MPIRLQEMTDSFENLAIDINQLPDTNDEEFSGIDPEYKKVILIGWSIFFLALIIAFPIAFYFAEEVANKLQAIIISIASIAVFWLANVIWVNKAFKKKKYLLRQKDLIYCKGLLWTKRTTVPFNRIQHAEVKQGPIDRIFKLHILKVFTAGGSSSDLSIPGLKEDKATRLKEYILNEIETEPNGTD